MEPPNLDLLRSFLAIVEAGSFTIAARQLGVLQSTMSQRMIRLEAAIGRPLLERDTHHVTLTPDGQVLVRFARTVVEANERLCGFFSPAGQRTRLRLGVSEDFTLSALAGVLARFSAAHAMVDLQLTIGLSDVLYRGFDAGELDVIFCKRRDGDPRGELAWRERLVWVGRPGVVPGRSVPLPLVLYPPPSLIRKLAIDALEAAGRSWRVACTSGSLMGLRAAAEAGLGVAPHSPTLVSPGLQVVPQDAGLPPLGFVEFVVIGPGRHHATATALIDTILSNAAFLNTAVSDTPGLNTAPAAAGDH